MSKEEIMHELIVNDFNKLIILYDNNFARDSFINIIQKIHEFSDSESTTLIFGKFKRSFDCAVCGVYSNLIIFNDLLSSRYDLEWCLDRVGNVSNRLGAEGIQSLILFERKSNSGRVNEFVELDDYFNFTVLELK